MIDITLENFQTELLEVSQSLPVLLDIWAPWCEPCKQLGPVLEQLETEYAGRFKLAKLDADAVPQIAQQLNQMFGVRSIPFCVMFVDGQPADGFVGALPAEKIREFLNKHVPSTDVLHANDAVDQAEELIEAGDTDAALIKLQEALSTHPENDDTRYDFAKLLITTGRLTEAQTILAPALAQIPKQLRFEALAQWHAALKFVMDAGINLQTVPEYDVKITANKRDFEARYAKARFLFANDQWTEAMDELLEIVMRDKSWADEAARKTYVAILELLTPPKSKTETGDPHKTASGIELAGKAAMQEDPRAELVSRYRRKLSMTLN